jgi:hypothetical protein
MEYEIGSACGMNGREKEHVYVIGGKATGNDTTKIQRCVWII